MWKVLICFLIISLSFTVKSEDSIHFVEEKYSYELGEKCYTKPDNQTGICELISKCRNLDKIREKQLFFCSYVKLEPVICCRTNNNNNENGKDETMQKIKLERISDRKCQEYKDMLKPVENPPPSIVRGNITRLLEFPHMAAIGWVLPDDTVNWKCGGSIISDKFVLTAAHCTSDSGIAPSVVRVGDQNLVRDDDGAFPENFRIIKIIKHQLFIQPAVYNDIALLELNSTIYFYDFLRPACLWQTDSINYTNVIATGWGRTDHGDPSSDELRKVELNIVKNDICRTHYEITRKLKDGIVNSQVCVGDSEGGKDTCQGDSGGPIQIKQKYYNHHLYHIIGITSFGKICGSSVPSVYTRVSSYLDWIENIVWPEQ